jgi:hypothetical protein
MYASNTPEALPDLPVHSPYGTSWAGLRRSVKERGPLLGADAGQSVPPVSTRSGEDELDANP